AKPNRTPGDVGGETILGKATSFMACPAVPSPRVVEAVPDIIPRCPGGIFVHAATGGERVEVGYRRMPARPMPQATAPVDDTAREAAQP
ncbi:MAG: DUF302 domain-containing protein, partial [Pseudomonadota bacterium]